MVFVENEHALAFKVKHKKSGIEFRHCMRYELYDHDQQRYLAKETLKCKLIEIDMGIMMNPDMLPETRFYDDTNRNKVINKKTGKIVHNGYYSPGIHLQSFIDDHLDYFDNLPARNMQTFDNKPKDKKKKS